VDLDLGCVSSFLVLVEERHYGRAATRLHLTTSALTKRMQRLERQVGTSLVARTSTGELALTAGGRRFAERAGPLLQAAEAARRAAVAEPTPRRSRLTLGLPAGPIEFLRQVDLGGVARQVRSTYPKLRIQCRSVPFPKLTSCLLDGEVDLLWTAAAVRHPSVTSLPLPVSVRRMGLVSYSHELAEATAIHVGGFVELPMLFNPAIPEEWMSVFYLGDVRPRREARLVEAPAADVAGMIQMAARGQQVVVAPEMFADLVRPHLRPLALTGAPELVFHLAHRRTERVGPVAALVAALLALPRQRLTSSGSR